MIKCYKYNTDACCNSVHDDFINDFISNLLTTACTRKFQELEDLVCYGCHPNEYYYTDNELKTIKVCRSFALKLWNATTDDGLEMPTTRFDKCGFKVSNPSFSKLTDKPYLIPSNVFNINI